MPSNRSEAYELALPFRPFLGGDAFTVYRMNYRNFRRGYAKGAAGETADVARQSSYINLQHQSAGRDLPDKIIHVDSGESPGGASPGGQSYLMEDTEMLKISSFISDLDRFRSDYRNFRRGQSKGAQRELSDVTKNITSQHLALLPVSQLRQLILAGSESLKGASNYEKDKSLIVTDGGFRDRLQGRGFRPTKFHVHFGAGKLGLGLVVPSMVASNKSFAIINERLTSWQRIIEGSASTVNIKVNGTHVTSMTVLRSGDPLPPLPPPDAPPLRLFVVSDEDAKIAQLICMATSYSTALGPAIGQIGTKIDEAYSGQTREADSGGLKPTLFACENDHKAVDALTEQLRDHVDVVHCMVDRICTGRDVTAEEISVTTEPDDGAIVVMTPSTPPAYAPAFGGSCFSLPLVEAEAQYFANRKITIVNGMHTTLAFMTLCHAQQDGDDDPRSHDLLTSATLPEEKQREVYAWAVARVLMILNQHDKHVIKHAHGVLEDEKVAQILIDYATRTLQRFTTIPDTTGRILSGGVTNRWQTRLKPVDLFLMTYDVDEIPLGKTVLRLSGLKETFLLKAVRRLVENTYRFTGLSVVHRQAEGSTVHKSVLNNIPAKDANTAKGA
ncbi:unnamed protein product [Vitrella brassicaformis CCMP3155]|uniref:Uncharacterized protein n=2 Tax=Vitrella brassicaformis TaxID=1169539 RepID=A0A0G4EUF0_VITBC|nr:unnamed protein product [Vitrella brassicaformis CCMP3155]|eukprot:CEM01835.1 unnamed protein product [Vitrella brassicaformis CCMP3155]